MSESKTYKTRITLDNDQITEALAAFFGMPKKDVYLAYDSEDGVVAMIEKEMQFPEKEKEREYVYIPMRNYEPWTPAWDPLKPNIVWCGTETNPVDISTSPTITAENCTTRTTTTQMHFDVPNENT